MVTIGAMATTVRVYRYGLLRPIELGEEVWRQMRAAHDYRNKLIEIERRRRDEMRELLGKHGNIPVLTAEAEAAEAEIAAVIEQRNRTRIKERSKKSDGATADALKAARERKKKAMAALREARVAMRADDSITAARDTIEEKYAAERREARAACGVYWGTYLLIEAADQQARKTPLYDGIEPNNPRFVRWENEGRVGVQVQGGAEIGEAKTLIRIEPRPAPKGADPQSKRSAKRSYCTLAMRIGTNEDRSPIWAKWPMVMHRPLPEGAVIKWATVNVRRIGPREQWHCCITAEVEEKARDTEKPRVAIDIGWRVVDEGLRVATWRSDDGRTGTLVLNNHEARGLAKADELRAIRDRSFNEARDALLKNLPETRPEWWPNNIGQWRSQARLAALIRKWKNDRFAGDEVAYEAAEAWRYHDYHLWQWETSQRAKSINHRRDVYRVFASKLAEKFGSVVLEDFDLRDVARRSEGTENEHARYMRTVAATSELRLYLKQAFRGDVEIVPSEYTTKTCAECGSLESWDQAAQLVHTCGACGATWDQDHNATKNLLAYQQGAGASEKEEAAEPKESKWSRAKRMADEKKKRREVARATMPQ